MKVWSVLLLLCAGASARLGAPPFPDFLEGNWIQVLSSRYVQQTAEIDWDCVRIQFSRTPDSNVTITKTGIMHNRPELVATVIRDYQPELVENRWVFHPLHIHSLRRIDLSLDYHNGTEIAVVSSDDRLSVCVWTRTWDTYTQNSRNISKILHQLDFATYYRFPIPSFTEACLLG
ncbi:hypothetical protein EBZ80_03510 [bacterium]|nr:hypothetical protein [bacterium]